MNKTSLGLHAWGNVVPCCSPCNNEKQQKPWKDFIKIKAGNNAQKRIERTERIQEFVSSKNYLITPFKPPMLG